MRGKQMAHGLMGALEIKGGQLPQETSPLRKVFQGLPAVLHALRGQSQGSYQTVEAGVSLLTQGPNAANRFHPALGIPPFILDIIGVLESLAKPFAVAGDGRELLLAGSSHKCPSSQLGL